MSGRWGRASKSWTTITIGLFHFDLLAKPGTSPEITISLHLRRMRADHRLVDSGAPARAGREKLAVLDHVGW